MNRNVVIVTVVVVLLAVVGFFAYQNFAKKAAPGTAIDVSGFPFEGDPNAKVTVVAFEDFKCPACKNYDATVMPQIEQKYIQPGKIKYAFVGFPIIAANYQMNPDDSRAALNAGYCVADQSNAAFFRYAHILFSAQKPENTLWATPDFLKELAQTLEGVDQAKLAQCIDSNANSKKVEAGYQLAVKQKVDHTPSIYVNGKLADDPLAAIDAALKAAQ